MHQGYSLWGPVKDGEFHLCKHQPARGRYLVRETDVLFNKYTGRREVQTGAILHFEYKPNLLYW